MTNEHDSGSGRDRATSPETFIQAVRDLGGTAYTDEIAAQVSCQERTAERALNTLKDDDEMTSRNTDDGELWILPEVGDV